MSSTPRPHDLLWLNHASALEAIAEPWVAQQWRAALPVVVRRDVDDQARIPVGVRGMKREQRAAGWVQAHNIVRCVTPEMLVERERLLGSLCFTAAGSGGYRPYLTPLVLALGRHRQYRLCAGNRDPGAACGKRSGSADPRAAAAGSRGAARVAGPCGPTAVPRRYPGRNALRRLRP